MRACINHILFMDVFLESKVMHTIQTQRFISEHRIPTLGGTDLVLTELVPNATISEVEDAIRSVHGGGEVPILAYLGWNASLVNARHRLADFERNMRFLVS